MAIAFTARANIGANAATVTTASFTPTANSRLFAVGGARPSVGATPTITDSTGGVWTALPGSAIKFGNVGGTFSYLNIGASPVPMTVTVSSLNSTQVGVQCFDATGGGTDMTNFKVNTNAAGDPSVTLDAMASSSYGIAAFVGNAGAAPTASPVGYSSVYSAAVATNLRMNLYTDATSPGTAQAWTTASTDSIAFGFEIKEPVAVGGTTGMKVWGGSSWAEKPVKAWTGSAWATKPVKRWSGSAWVGGVAAPTAPTSWLVTSFTPGGERDDYSGEVGIRIQPSVDKAFTWIGLNCATGNTGLHSVKLYNFSTQALLRSANVDLTGKTPGTWGWASIASITLTAGTYYAVVKETTAGGGQLWWDMGATALAPAFVSDVMSVYGAGGVLTANGDDMQYVGLDLGWNVVGGPPYFDNFDRPNAALEASAVASGGWSWTHDGLIAGAFALNSHALRCTTTNSAGSAYKVPDLGSADHYVEYKVPLIPPNAGSFACCRLADNNNFLGMRTDLATVEVWRRNAGTLTSLYTQPTAVVAGDILRLEVSGLNYLVKKNGAILKASSAIGGTALTATTAGVVARTLVATPFDNFQAGV